MKSDRHAQLIYVHDPMCSWCWGFRPTLTALIDSLPPAIQVLRLLGGLAADNDEVMEYALQERLQATWRRIQEHIPGTEFNFDFWRACVPRRSTYPACRAVIAARDLDPEKEDAMILAIQTAYYTRALNPSDTAVLERLASGIGLHAERFSEKLRAASVEKTLQQEIALTRAMGVHSFPALLLRQGEGDRPIPIDYRHADNMLDSIQRFLESPIWDP